MHSDANQDSASDHSANSNANSNDVDCDESKILFNSLLIYSLRKVFEGKQQLVFLLWKEHVPTKKQSASFWSNFICEQVGLFGWSFDLRFMNRIGFSLGWAKGKQDLDIETAIARIFSEKTNGIFAPSKVKEFGFVKSWNLFEHHVHEDIQTTWCLFSNHPKMTVSKSPSLKKQFYKRFLVKKGWLRLFLLSTGLMLMLMLRFCLRWWYWMRQCYSCSDCVDRHG